MTMNRHPNHAVSEILSVVLLLGITIALFGFLNYIVFSFSFDSSPPSVNLIGSISADETYNNIVIEHNGGEPLNGNTEIIITIGSTTNKSRVREIIDGTTNWELTPMNDDRHPDQWDFGESIQYYSPYDFTDTFIQVAVRDPTTNTLILSTVLQQGPTTSVFTNKPPTLITPNPGNGFSGIPITTTLLTITIRDSEGNPFDWTITTSPNIGNNTESADTNGTKTCVIAGLTYATTYTWTVKAFDGQHWTNRSYTFTTSLCPAINTSVNTIIPYVNPSSLITATGISDLDNVTLYYRWSDDNMSWTGGLNEKLDGVDNNKSNIDTTPNIGKELNFFNIKNKIVRNGLSMTLIEEKITGKYQIDFEYNWTAATSNTANGAICLYVLSHTGTEDLLVNYWTGSTWFLLGKINGTGARWYNFTTLGLTSSIYTIQLKGAAETNDNIQDTWNIDVIILQTWNVTGGPHGQNWTPWLNETNPDTENPWSWNFNFPKGAGYYEFYSIGKTLGYCGGDTESAPINADARCRKL